MRALAVFVIVAAVALGVVLVVGVAAGAFK
jgi:hypothetical protein